MENMKNQTLQDFVSWSLHYAVPPFREVAEYIYYTPFPEHDHPAPYFQVVGAPLDLTQIQTARLVPASMPARIHLALEYHEILGGGTTFLWLDESGGGEVIAWYEDVQLWGGTAFHPCTGKQGTLFATSREAHLARLLLLRGMPCPGGVQRVRGLPGMGSVNPVLLPLVQGSDPVPDVLQYTAFRIASEQTPVFQREGEPGEWQLTVLNGDRSLWFYHASLALPTCVEVLRCLCGYIHRLESCRNESAWMQLEEAKRMPYTVCERIQGELKSLLGPKYNEFLQAFGGKREEAR